MTQKAIEVSKNDNNSGLVQLQFTNGYILSMNVGRGGYNDNRNIPSPVFPEGDVVSRLSTDTAECAVFDPNGEWVTKEFFPNADDGDKSVAGWVEMVDLELAIVEIIQRPMRSENE